MESGRKRSDVFAPIPFVHAGFAPEVPVAVPKRCVLHCISASFGVFLPTS